MFAELLDEDGGALVVQDHEKAVRTGHSGSVSILFARLFVSASSGNLGTYDEIWDS